MTRQEAAAILKELPYLSLKANTDWAIERDINYQVAVNMAIKALEQEPCEDAISRQAAIDIVRHECGEWKGLAKEIVKQFNGLPPVQPKPKTGHWIDINNHYYYNDEDIETTELRCSHCNEIIEWDIESLHKPYYCENCGCRMIEPQESEG